MSKLDNSFNILISKNLILHFSAVFKIFCKVHYYFFSSIKLWNVGDDVNLLQN